MSPRRPAEKLSATRGFERATGFEEAIREQCAERVVPFRFGRALFNDTFPLVWDLNVVRVDEPAGATAELLAEEAERLFDEARHTHRRVTVLDEADGKRLEPEFRALGWQPDCFLFMGWRGIGEREAVPADIREVEPSALRPLREEILRAEPWADSPEVVRQVIDSSFLVARTGNARHFAALVDGEVAGGADLYSDGRTAQVEDVSTFPAHRGRGLASAVVLHAVEEALSARHDFVFLIADDTDWPKELYRRLGFAPLGRKSTFLRRLPSGDPSRI
jgi:ribosomal protein S18 acetylase RimI-like enzyme